MNSIYFSHLVVDFFRRNKVVALSLVIFGVLGNCLTIFLSLSIGVFYETLTHHNSNKVQILHLFHISLPREYTSFIRVFLLLILTATLFQFLFRLGSQKLALDFSFWLRKKLFRHHLRMGFPEYSKKSIGSFLLRYSGDLRSSQSYLEKGIFQFSSDLFFVAFGLFVLFHLQLQASLYVVSGLIAGFSLMQYLSVKINKIEDRRINLLSSNLAFIHESLHNIETIKSWNKEYSAIRRFKNKTDLLHRESVQAIFWKSLHHVLPFAIMFLLLLLVFSTHLKSQEEFGSSFISYMLLLLLMFPAFKRTMRISPTWKTGIARIRKIELILAQPLEKEEGLEDFKFPEGKVEFKNVSFSYGNKTKVISNFNKIWKSGQINYVDFIGETTVFKLLIGLYEPLEGDIFLDGTNLKTCSLKSIRQKIAFCSDHTHLHGNTVFKCLFLDKDFNEDEVMNCLRLVQFSMEDEKGKFNLHYRIGKGGNLLSQSDSQKLKVARTLLSRKKVLVFDGIIETLEAEVQQAVISYLETIKNEKTIILTAKFVDRFINDGEKLPRNNIEDKFIRAY